MPAAKLFCAAAPALLDWTWWDEPDIAASGDGVTALEGPNGTTLAVLPQRLVAFEVVLHRVQKLWPSDPQKLRGKEATLTLPDRFQGGVLIADVRTRAQPVVINGETTVIRSLVLTCFNLEAMA